MSLFLQYARSTELYRALCQVSTSGEGNLLERTDDRTAESQVEFLRWAISLARPTTAIEIGTNKGFFLYLLSLLNQPITVNTFDCDPQAARAVQVVNQAATSVSAIFHAGDSRITLPAYSGHADFAWIDGGHEFEISLSDLLQCYRLRIPFIAVDDTAFPTVKDAVDYVVDHAPYKVIANPFSSYDRRQALLLKLDENRPNA